MVVSAEKFAAANIPFIGDKARATLASDYAPAADFKAFSLNIGGFNAFVTGQPSEEAAKSAAVEQCQKRADAAQSPRKCELYAVGDTVVYAHGKPPMPPLPWIRHDAATEQPFVAKNVPLTREAGKARLEKVMRRRARTRRSRWVPAARCSFRLRWTVSRKRCGVPWSCAAGSPASPA